jgi:hypothetical protein
MHRRLFVGALVVLTALMPMGAAAAAPPTEEGVSGRFTFRPHTHTSGLTPSGDPTLVATDPAPVPLDEGTFTYSSLSCEDPAPFNDVSLDFNPSYPGIDDPASTRSVIEITVVDAEAGTVEGTVTTFLCENGQETDQIVYAFEGTTTAVSDNQAALVGTFEVVSGTGPFADLEGSGRLRGALTCLQPVLEQAGAESCADLGFYSDAVMTLRGQFSDPTA